MGVNAVARGAQAVAVIAALAGSGCVDIVGADLGKFVEREEKHFTTAGRPDVSVSTFDGSIEIRPWDKPDVQVVVEKHARDKADADEIEVRAEQNGNHVIVEVKTRNNDHGFHFGWNSRSARLIVSAPATADVAARSGDGSIDVERITGRLELKSGDGSIRGRELGGAVTAHSGDGSIKLEGVSGALDVDTGDGSIVVAGKLTAVRARSGDGSVTVRAESGSAPNADWNITTGDGSVTLEVPEDFGAELDAHTGDGRVRLQDVTVSNVVGEMGKSTVKGRLGSGGPALRVRTGDGSITVRRQ
ncbi:MAG: DUF4097 family beta strand repeat protein [Acidobacteria bacterium]|nr:DUF4097 family beta strand repeat protein [Acidobacteriota bacterium]